MNKMERKKKRLIAWVLCVILTVVTVIPSAEMRAFASEPESEQGDPRGDILNEESEQTEIDENALKTEAVRRIEQEKETVPEKNFAEDNETLFATDEEAGTQAENLDEEEIPVEIQTKIPEELSATYSYGTLVLLSNGGKFSSGQTKIIKNFTGTYLSDGTTPFI